MTFEEWLETSELRTVSEITKLAMKAAWEAAETKYKPNWDDAPSWANYLAIDARGKWFWFEFPPTKHFEYTGGRVQMAIISDWELTMEKRP